MVEVYIFLSVDAHHAEVAPEPSRSVDEMTVEQL